MAPRKARFATCARLYEREVVPKLVDQRRCFLAMKLLGWWFTSATNTPSIQQYAIWRAKHGIENATIRREINVYMAIMNHARRAGLIDTAPACPRIPTPSKAEGLRQEEVNEIVARSKAEISLHLFVVIALNTGARPGAIMGLTWDRVNQVNKTIDFNDPLLSKQGRRKGRAVVPINSALAAALRWPGMSPGIDKPKGRVVQASNINVLWRRHIGFSRPHDLRHTVATEIARRHGLLAAAAMLGHKSIKTTERVYVHIQADHLREQAETLGKYNVDND